MKKLNILIIDPLEPKGHILFNKSLIKSLEIFGNVFFVGSKEYLNNFDCGRIILKKQGYYGNNKYFYRLWCLNRLFKIKREVKLESYDIIIFSSFETISFSIFSKFLKCNVFLINHNNIDELKKSFIKRFFYKTINHNIILWCFEDYICEYVTNITRFNQVFIPHPLLNEIKLNENDNESFESIMFAPSGSGDKKWILKIFNEEKDFFFYAKYDNQISDNNNYLCNYFENYKEIFCKARCIFLPINFEYRVSGPFFEAMSLSKPIIMTSSKFAVEMRKLYPNSIRIIEKPSDINRMFNEVINIDKKEREKDIQAFYKKHDISNVSSVIRESIIERYLLTK